MVRRLPLFKQPTVIRGCGGVGECVVDVSVKIRNNVHIFDAINQVDFQDFLSTGLMQTILTQQISSCNAA